MPVRTWFEPSCYRTKKIDAEDLKPGDRFYDSRDKRLYVTKGIMQEKSSRDVIISTVETNSRQDQLIKKSAYTKLMLQEFKY
ncbi:MAG: hypothetical protein ACRC78_04340 [Planktothrix sp.]